MKILIIEDEELAVKKLHKMLIGIDDSIEVIANLDSIESSVEWLENNETPDLIMMDIELLDGQSFEIFNRVKVKSPVIFTTSYDEYALKAFRNNGVAYVQKPVEEDELKEAMEKARKMLSPQENITRLLAMLQPQTPKYRERFLIPKGDQFQIVNSFSISHFDVDGKNTIAYLEDGTSVHISESMNELEAELDPKMFFRCSRQHIINIEDIVKMESTWNAKLILRLRRYPEKDFEVSRDRVKELKEKLNQ